MPGVLPVITDKLTLLATMAQHPPKTVFDIRCVDGHEDRMWLRCIEHLDKSRAAQLHKSLAVGVTCEPALPTNMCIYCDRGPVIWAREVMKQ